jgi:hypothetical protein
MLALRLWTQGMLGLDTLMLLLLRLLRLLRVKLVTIVVHHFVNFRNALALGRKR